MKLKDLVEICYGKNQSQVEVEESKIPILGTGGIIGYSSKSLYDKESVLIGRKGTIGMPFYINKPFWTIDTLFFTKININIVIPKYLYYLLCTIHLERYSEGAAVPSLTTKTLYEIDLDIPNIEHQQHIVNTIGSIDDLIENLNKQTDLITKKCVLMVDSLSKSSFIQFEKYGLFKKGIEVGSTNYSEIKTASSQSFIRVGDLLKENSVFIKNNIVNNNVQFSDILIAFDGAPGRNGFGFVGSYSSGLYKLICQSDIKGLLYFSLNSIINQRIIKNYSKGTTILHASEAIKFLVCPNTLFIDQALFNSYFKYLIVLKKKILSLKNIKCTLLNKYFSTNQ